jgi:hypothetical protein
METFGTLSIGVSQAFDHNNVTFLLLDQFKPPDYYTSYITDRMPWIKQTLRNRSGMP